MTKDRGVKVIDYWPAKIQEAQQILAYNLDGVDYLRVPYDNATKPCHDCAVFQGELHVPGCVAVSTLGAGASERIHDQNRNPQFREPL